MDRRDASNDTWGQGIGFWFRLWQLQFEQALKIWAACASALPHPTAADLSASAEAQRQAETPKPPRPKRDGPRDGARTEARPRRPSQVGARSAQPAKIFSSATTT